jgi:uncharacterized membrane protein YhaH (DUF805 family)/putative flippase GtrA
MQRLTQLLRFWFTFDAPVSRRAYILHGAALMALKYAVDASLIWVMARTLWTPWDYLTTGAAFTHSKLAGAPKPLLSLLALWTLPFLWIGLTMSIRRALDAGRSAWLALLFFVPLVNYGLMALLSVLPTSASRGMDRMPRPGEARLPSALLSIAIGVGIDIGMLFLSVYALRDYGISLFLGTPFVVGAISAFVFNRRYAASQRETIQLVLVTLAAIGGVMFTFGFEGAICMLMAAPLAIGIAVLGALVGRAIAVRDPYSPTHALLALVLLPPASPLVAPTVTVGLHEVRSAIEIDAPPEVVWSRVIAFPALAEPSALVRRMGIAYPRRARIEGAGVGAVRYCEFSTGAFVEPIRIWEPGRRLSFDVTREPPPLREWSPYANVVPPHLDGFFRARRGEFRLVRLTGNRTRLEGSTWYALRIYPVVYWSVFADVIVSRIHHRVLAHIKGVAEHGKSVSADGQDLITNDANEPELLRVARALRRPR